MIPEAHWRNRLLRHVVVNSPDVFDTDDLQSNTSTPMDMATAYADHPSAIRPEFQSMQSDRERNISCARLYAGDKTELSKALAWQTRNQKIPINDSDYISMTSDCQNYITRRQYILNVSAEEHEFPLAFGIVMHRDVEQVERILRAIYRPQNFYSIHVDKKANLSIKEGMSAIAKCFPNIRLTYKAVSVKWGKYSLLEAHLLCMKEVLGMSTVWKYYINLTGQEWPLKTNLELVRILKAVNGSNLIVGSAKT